MPKATVWSELGEPLYVHECHGEGCFYVGVFREEGTNYDVWLCDTGDGTKLLARWTSRECDVELTTEDRLVFWAIERLDFLNWTLGEYVKSVNGGEPC